jgi:predicted RNase H-like nuclease
MPDRLAGTLERIQAEISATVFEIHAALWATLAANMDRAKVLISKRMGLRICAGERSVKLKPPAAAMKAQGRNAFDLLAA